MVMVLSGFLDSILYFVCLIRLLRADFFSVYPHIDDTYGKDDKFEYFYSFVSFFFMLIIFLTLNRPRLLEFFILLLLKITISLYVLSPIFWHNYIISSIASFLSKSLIRSIIFLDRL